MDELAEENITTTGEEIKESVVEGQRAYKNGEIDKFEVIDPKDLWK